MWPHKQVCKGRKGGILWGEEQSLKLVVLWNLRVFENTPQCCIKKKILKLPLCELWFVGACGLGGELSASSLKANQGSNLNFIMSLVVSIHRVMADWCCGSSQNKLQLSKSKFRWLVTQGWSVCAQVSRAGLCFPRQAVLGGVCRVLWTGTVLTVQDRIWEENWWIGWIHKPGLMGWFLGAGKLLSKMGRGAWFQFSAVIIRRASYVFMWWSSGCALRAEHCSTFSQLAHFDQVSVTQLRNKRQSKTLQIRPFLQAVPVFFPGNGENFYNVILTLAACTLSSNFFTSFLEPISCSQRDFCGRVEVVEGSTFFFFFSPSI